MAKDDDNDFDLPEAPPIQMVTETFSQVTVKKEKSSNSDNSKNDKE